MITRKMALAGGLALSLAALAAGCGSSSTTSNASSTTSTKPVSGGTIVVAMTPQTNNTWYFPLANSSNNLLNNYQLIYQLYKPLLWINTKYTINYKSSIADKVTYNKAGTVYHVFMNPKWKWSDGDPVTSSNVLWTWKIIQATSASTAPAPWPFVGAGSGDVPQGIQSVTANGQDEFTVTLKKPANQEWFIYNGLTDFIPLPEQVWNKYPNNITQEITYLGKQATNPSFDSVVDGPYKLQSAIANESWTLTPNQQYSGHKAYDKVVFAYEGSNSAEFAGLKTGTVQVGYVDLSEYGARGELTNDSLFGTYPLDYFYIAVNQHSNAKGGLGPVFSQLYVRQAMEEAINQPSADTSIYHGYAPPQYGPIPNVPATSYLSPQLKTNPYPYNPTKAKKLLTSHGWHEVNGVMTKGGLSLSFPLVYSSGATDTTEDMELVQQNLSAIGIKVTLKPEPFATMVGLVTTPGDEGQWDAASGLGIIYGGSYPTGEADFGTTGGNNFAGYTSSEENSLIAATHEPSATPQANLQTFYAYENYTALQVPYIWTNQSGTLDAVQKSVHDVKPNLNALTGYSQMQYWWVSR